MIVDRLLVATTNAGKFREIQMLLADLPVGLAALTDLPPIEPPVETGRTFAENARLKAVYYGTIARLPVVAEDSGLVIDALGGRPGVESARFGGIGTTYPEKFALLHEQLAHVSGLESPARFICALALAIGGTVRFEAEGVVEGRIASSPRGVGGFGYDPIFYYPPFGCTLAEAADRKALVSHRARAFGELRRFLER